jgi:O-antigen/teichoic acid export membrane protein
MSRIRRLSNSLSSGYVQIFANTAFTLLSVPLALYYLSKSEFGLWALVTQVVGYISMVELGMTAAMGRVLIDHKDRPAEGTYGSVIKTGCLVLVVQGALVALLSWSLGWLLPKFLDIPPELSAAFNWLVSGYGLIVGLLFPQRMLLCVYYAHQRYDVLNYSAAGSFALNLAVLWLGFHFGLGVYSLLVSNVFALLLQAVVQVELARRLHLLPPRGAWGQFDKKVFREIFLFGSDLFLLSLGLQLLNGSQTIIITRVLGLEAAAVWSVATKLFTLAQQFVWRLWDFSVAAISEMMVRNEDERLRRRFHDIFAVTGSVAVFVGVLVALCNESVLSIWTRNKISWNAMNDVLMAIMFVVTSLTRLYAGYITTSKKIQALRYIYFLEGISFVTAAVILARWWGFAGVVTAGIVMNILWSGIYGTYRISQAFHVPRAEMIGNWVAPTARLTLALAPLGILCWWLVQPLTPVLRLAVSGFAVGTTGAFLLWTLGLPPALREELGVMFVKIRHRLKLGKSRTEVI